MGIPSGDWERGTLRVRGFTRHWAALKKCKTRSEAVTRRIYVLVLASFRVRCIRKVPDEAATLDP